MRRIPLLICFLMATLLISCQNSGASEHLSKEYQVVKVSGQDLLSQTEMLNNWGKDGWEIESIDTDVTSSGSGNGIDVGTYSIVHILKRPYIYIDENKQVTNKVAWEYRLLQAAGKTQKAHTASLNELGEMGWILVGTYTEIGPVRYIRRDIRKIQTSAINFNLSRTNNAVQSKEQQPHEYKIIQTTIEKDAEQHTALLNEAGAERWELASTYTIEGEVGVQRRGWRAGYVGTYTICYILKRPTVTATPTLQ